MSESKWTNTETFKFIELYQNGPAIWYPKNKYHKDKNLVNDAWKRIAEALSIPVSEVKKKKETLMAAFRVNHKKVKSSMKSGAGSEDILKPIWIYYDVLAAFLSNVYECKSVLNTEDEDTLENEGSAENTPSEDLHEDRSVPVQPQIQQKRRCQKPVELDETRAHMNTALTTLNNAITNKKQKTDDSWDLYGRLLANKLRALPEIEREELMYEIDGLILKKRKRVQMQEGTAYQIVLSRPTSSRTMYSSYSRPSSTNTNYSMPFSPPDQSMNFINSPPQDVIINHAPSPIMYVSQSEPSPQQLSQDILSQACSKAKLYDNY